MKQTPIHVIVAGLRRMPLAEQVNYLIGEAKKERIHSVRRNELESLLRGKRSKQLAEEVRQQKRAQNAAA